MKKTVIASLAMGLLVLGFAACTKAGAPAAGSASAADMLSMLPKAAHGVVVVDLHAGLNVAFVDKAIKDSKDNQKYLEFVKETGIDPQKDVYFAVVGLMGPESMTDNSPAIIVNLKYDKAKLLAKLKEKATNVSEETYEGLTLYTVPDADEKKPMTGCFFDGSNIIFGQAQDVKAVIDVVKKGADSVLKNEGLSGLLKSADQSALLWAAVKLPAEAMKALATQNPMASSLENMKSMLLALEYKNKALRIEIKGLGGDAEKNKQTAEALSGLKALGAMAAGEKPEIGELVNKIEVSSSGEFVKIAALLPDELLAKLGTIAQETVKEKLAGAQGEEKKAEEKVEKKAEAKVEKKAEKK